MIDNNSSAKNRNRQTIRLRGYDYSQPGVYFITICTKNRECIFGKIAGNKIHLSPAGLIVVEEWLNMAETCSDIELDSWVVMPNHFHALLVVTTRAYKTSRQLTMAQRRNMTVPKIVGRFKMLSAKRINAMQQTPGMKLWQRNYWDHIVRNKSELNRIREYIHNNPAQWESDTLFVDGHTNRGGTTG